METKGSYATELEHGIKELTDENAELRELLWRCMSKIKLAAVDDNPKHSKQYKKTLVELHRDIEAALKDK